MQPAASQAPLQPTAQMPVAAGYAPGPQPAAPSGQATAQQTTGMKPGVIIALVVVGVFVVSGLAVGGFFAWRAFSGPGPDVAISNDPVDTPPEEATQQPEPASGYATPEEALAEYLPADWVFDAISEQADSVEYIIGPPASEYVEGVVVTADANGRWSILETYPLDTQMGGDEIMTPEQEATQVVGEFLYAVKEDRADDAHTFTISPFAEDPASASYSNGDLLSIEITDAQLQSDGTTVLVRSKEVWRWGTESYIYECVPTQAGYRIREMRIP